MSINKLISIRTPIVDAMDLLDIDYMQNIPVFTRWATLAEKEIKSYFQYERKICTLPIKGHLCELPCDAEFLQRAIVGQINNSVDLFNNLCSQILLNSTTINASALGTFLIMDVGSGYTTILGSIPHVVQDNKILLNQNMDGQYLTIQYLGYKTDDEGFLMIGQNHVQAITWYILWKFWIRKRHKTPLEYGQMNKAEQEWHRECANARAKDGTPTESEHQEMTSMLWDPYIGQGLCVGMNTTLGNYFGW